MSPNTVDCEWWQETAKVATAVCFTKGRIKFYGPSGEGGSPTRGQTFLYFGKTPQFFLTAFAILGFTIPTPQLQEARLLTILSGEVD